MANITRVNETKREKFLDILRSTANASLAAKATGISRGEWYRERRANEQFAADWLEAVELGTCALEDEAVRRAFEGTERPVFHLGVECGRIREYSDTLLIFMLKARRPLVYRDRTDLSLTGRLTLEDLLAGTMSDEK